MGAGSQPFRKSFALSRPFPNHVGMKADSKNDMIGMLQRPVAKTQRPWLGRVGNSGNGFLFHIFFCRLIWEQVTASSVAVSAT
jgi:hypothetical protein